MLAPSLERSRALLGRSLERGVRSAPWLEPLERLWRWRADGARPLTLPEAVPVVGVGGATLGGSGKTPLVQALARALAGRGLRVAVVGHAYRARPGRCRVVQQGDGLAEVGDEALALHGALEQEGVPVLVGPSRGEALRAAARGADLVLVDGLLQARPRPLTSSLLVVDAVRPWGSGRCPPLGDLRARRERLLAHADAVVAVSDVLQPAPDPARALGEAAARRPVFEARGELRALIDRGGSERPPASLRGARVGVVLAVARPERVLATLERRGLAPDHVCLLGDHGRGGPQGPLPRLDAWLATPKCAVRLPSALAGAPVLALDYRLRPPEALIDHLLRSGLAAELQAPRPPSAQGAPACMPASRARAPRPESARSSDGGTRRFAEDISGTRY